MARSLNSGTDLINCSNAAVLNPSGAGATMTVSAWVNPRSFPNAYNTVVGRDDNAGHYYELLVKSNGKLALLYIDSTGATFGYDGSGVATLGANAWFHLAFTISGAAGSGLGTAYVNGVFDNSTLTNANGILSISAATCIGGLTPNTGAGWAGAIADVAIWNTALSGANIIALASGARPKDVNSANLVGWWPLGSSLVGGKEPDLSGNANNGTLTGTTLTASPNQIRRGARNLSMSTDVVTSPSSSILAPAAITLSIWAFPAILGGGNNNPGLITTRGGGAGTILLSGQASAAAFYYVNGSSVGGSHPIPTSVWTHFLMTYSNAAGGVGYFNGISDGTFGTAGAIPSGATAWNFGNDTFLASRQWVGAIADVGMWSTVLSAGDIAKLVSGVRPGNVSPGSLIGWWPLEANGATENDLSGNSLNGTVTGTTSWLGPPYTWRIG